jgi:RimJ/RimL family protein N-acetyltransferase
MQVTEWRRHHAVEPGVTLRVITSPLDGWIVSIEGWTASPHFRRTHPDIESAQRAADDVLINYRPHDCSQSGCGEWVPTAAGIVLRPYAVADAPRLCEAARESVEELMPWMPWCHPNYSLEDAQGWLEAQVKEFQAGTAFEFAITSPDGHYLGGCGVNQIGTLNRRGNIGYWVRSTAAGHGVAAIVKLAYQWAMENTNLIRLEILTAVGNRASLRVAEKVGALREGVLRKRLLLHDEAHDAVMFSLIR